VNTTLEERTCLRETRPNFFTRSKKRRRGGTSSKGKKNRKSLRAVPGVKGQSRVATPTSLLRGKGGSV